MSATEIRSIPLDELGESGGGAELASSDRVDSGVWLGQGTTMDEAVNGTAAATGKTLADRDEPLLSSQKGATINLINCAIGAGIVGLPHALSHSGVIIGVPLLALVCYLTHYAIMLIIKMAHANKVMRFQDLVERLLGRSGFVIFSLAQFILPFGTLCAYGIIIGDYLVHLEALTGISLFGNRTFVILSSTILLMLPLSLYTNMAKLEYFSAVSVGSVLVIILAIGGKMLLLLLIIKL